MSSLVCCFWLATSDGRHRSNVHIHWHLNVVGGYLGSDGARYQRVGITRASGAHTRDPDRHRLCSCSSKSVRIIGIALSLSALVCSFLEVLYRGPCIAVENIADFGLQFLGSLGPWVCIAVENSADQYLRLFAPPFAATCS